MDGNRWRRVSECGYVALVGALAVTGGIRADPHFYVTAIVLAVPFSLPAVVVIYGGYALLAGVGGLFAAATLQDGSDASWLTAASASLNAVALVIAACANVLLVDRPLRRRIAAGPRGATAATPAPER